MAVMPDVTANHGSREKVTTWQQNLKCIMFCALVSLATLQYGLDVSIINGAQAIPGFLRVFGYPKKGAPNDLGIATEFQQSITSLMNIGLVTGSLLLESCSHRFGRRRNFILGSAAGIGANLILIISTNKSAVIFGRFLFGVSNGLYIGFTSMYISEAAPAHLRGALVTFVQLSVCIGTIIGAVVNNATKDIESRLSYQIPLFTLFLIPVICIFNAFFVPESPRWLILRGRHDEARHHLTRLRGSAYPPEIIDSELAAITTAIEIEQQTTIRGLGAVKMMFGKKELKRTLLVIGAGTMHGASGFPFISSYKTYFFQVAKSQEPFIDSIIVTTISTLGAFGGIFANRYIGRRPLLLTGFLVQAGLMLVIAAVWTANPGTVTTGKVIVAMVVIFQSLYACIVGPTSWICAAEIPNTRLRAMSFGFGNGVGFLAYFLIAFTTPYFINVEALNIGPQVGYIWFGSNLITALFVFVCLPETHRRSLEDIDEMFYNKVSVRKFKKYKCTGNIEGESNSQRALSASGNDSATHIDEKVDEKR